MQIRVDITGALSIVAAAILVGCSETEKVTVYRLVSAATRDILVSASAAGTIEPVKTVEVKSKASGEIVEVAVDIGDEVRRGDPLVRVDQRIPHNAVVQAEADLNVAIAELENAESQLRRAEALHASQSITEQELETARLAFANARARLVRVERDLEDARIALEDTEVRAATDGIVLSRQVEVGSVIQSASNSLAGGAVLLTMADLDTVQVRTLVDETDVGKVAVGLPVTITVDAYPQRSFSGNVLKIEPQAVVQQNVTMFPVLVRIGNEDGFLKPGMNSEVEIHIGSRQGVLSIPNTALRTERDIGSAGAVLGLASDVVQQQLASARQASRGEAAGIPMDGAASADEIEPSRAASFRGSDGSGRAGASARPNAAGVGRRAGPSVENGMEFQFGGEYIVFALRDGEPHAVPVRTGLTDLSYAEVVRGLADGDTVLVLPSASLVQSQQEWQDRVSARTGGVLSGGGGR